MLNMHPLKCHASYSKQAPGQLRAQALSSLGIARDAANMYQPVECEAAGLIVQELK